MGLPRETFWVRDLLMGKNMFRQAVIWHPPSSEEPGACANPADTYRRQAPRCSGIMGFYPQSGHLENTPEGPETRALGNDAEDDKLESEGSEKGKSGSRPEGDGLDGGSELGEPGGESGQGESDDSDEELGSEIQEVTVTVRRLYKLSTGKPHPLTGSWTQNGRTDNQ